MMNMIRISVLGAVCCVWMCSMV